MKVKSLCAFCLFPKELSLLDKHSPLLVILSKSQWKKLYPINAQEGVYAVNISHFNE